MIVVKSAIFNVKYKGEVNMKNLKILAGSAILACASAAAVQAGELTIATVNNGHMITM